MPGEAIALDLDGTILDARRRQCALIQWCLSYSGGDAIDLMAHWRLKREGMSTVDALQKAGVVPAIALAAGDLWRAHVEDENWLALDTPLPNSRSTLASLQAAGFKIVLITARQRQDALESQLKNCSLSTFFSEVCVVSPSDAARQKSEQLRRTSALGFVGDTEVDAQAAALAGVPFVAVTSGLRSRQFLTDRRCDSVGTLRAAVRLLLSDIPGHSHLPLPAQPS